MVIVRKSGLNAFALNFPCSRPGLPKCAAETYHELLGSVELCSVAIGWAAQAPDASVSRSAACSSGGRLRFCGAWKVTVTVHEPPAGSNSVAARATSRAAGSPPSRGSSRSAA